MEKYWASSREIELVKKQNKYLLIILTLFLGISPIGEPHLIGKVNWIVGGAKGMKVMDWFDFLMHGGAILIALVLIFSLFIKPTKSTK